MTLTKHKKSLMLICLLLAFMFATALFGASLRASASVADADLLYDKYNSDPLWNEIESKDEFKAFYEQYKITGREEFFNKLSDTADVLDSLKSFFNDYKLEDYNAVDRKKISNIKQAVVNSIEITPNFVRDDLLKIISDASDKITSEFKTVKSEFEDLRQAAIVKLSEMREELFSVNVNNPEGSVTETVGFYDEDAIAEVDKVYVLSEEAINSEVYVDVDSVDVFDSLLEQAAFDFDTVAKCDIGRSVNAINDYHAALSGFGELSPEDAKLIAKALCEAAYNEIILKASPDVISSYDNQISQVMSFLNEGFEEPEFDPSPKPVVETADGVVKITAYKRVDDKQELYPVFPRSSEVKVYNSANSAGRTNAQRAINKLNLQLDIGYFIYIDVYNGSNEWLPVELADDGAQIDYCVSIDLKAYYTNYVANYDGLIENALKAIPFLQSKLIGKDKTDAIIKADGYVRELINEGHNDSSLIYIYYRENGKGAVSPLVYEVDEESGIMMFYTNKFGTFSATVSGNNSLIANPFFWVIVILSVVILIIIAILFVNRARNIYRFDTDGGTPVDPIKLKKGDSFAMPSAPTKEGYLFGGWFIDKEFKIRFIETCAVSRKMKTIYAKWHDKSVPEKFVNYLIKLKNHLFAFGKLGPISDMGLNLREPLVKMLVDKDGVKLYLALSADKLTKDGYSVSESSEYVQNSALKTVANKEELKEALELVEIVMSEYGLQYIDSSDDFDSITDAEKVDGFEFVVENARVPESLADYFDYLRVYASGFVLYNPPVDVINGSMLARMYYTEECINLYLALPLSEQVINALDRFEDTCALIKIYAKVEDLQKAKELIERLMLSNGFERNNANANNLRLEMPQDGCGCAYRISF